MEELRRNNTKLAYKQFGRFVGGVGSAVIAMVLIGNFIYQKGATAEQKTHMQILSRRV